MPARFGGELPGRKPIAFCAWLFDCLGMVPGDTLDDLFPGTGIVARAWGELSSRKCAKIDDRLEQLAHDSEPSPLIEAASELAAPFFARTEPFAPSPLAELRPAVVFRPVELPPKPVQGTSVAPGVAADEVGQESGRSPPTRGAGAEPLRGSE